MRVDKNMRISERYRLGTAGPSVVLSPPMVLILDLDPRPLLGFDACQKCFVSVPVKWPLDPINKNGKQTIRHNGLVSMVSQRLNEHSIQGGHIKDYFQVFVYK